MGHVLQWVVARMGSFRQGKGMMAEAGISEGLAEVDVELFSRELWVVTPIH